MNFNESIRRVEAALIRRALRSANGSVTTASRLLGFNHHQVKCPLDGCVMELLAVGDSCGYWCSMCENTYDEDPPHAQLTETSETVDGRGRATR